MEYGLVQNNWHGTVPTVMWFSNLVTMTSGFIIGRRRGMIIIWLKKAKTFTIGTA